MSKDYKASERRRGRNGGSFMLGMLIGLLLGLIVALGVAWYINRMPSPFLKDDVPTKSAPAPAAPITSKDAEKPVAAQDAKPRFDFYTILPKTEQPAAEEPRQKAQKPPARNAKETFFLQAGAFQNAPDADNLKARLALMGLEATIQTTTLPDRGTWHRVRVGPYSSVEELARTRDTLKQNGVETTLVKVRTGAAR